MKLDFLYALILSVTFFAVCIGSTVNAGEAKQAADGSIKIESAIPFGKHIAVRDAVRSECDLGGKLSGFIQKYGTNYDLDIEQSADIAGAQGKVLRVEIVDAQGAGGGAWSGPKSVAIQGILTENGKEIGTFHGSRHSGGGAFGGFKSTCAIFGRCVKALGKDVAKWLKSPTMNASLGDD